jgi:glutaryl-CoA dehydrogenase
MPPERVAAPPDAPAAGHRGRGAVMDAYRGVDFYEIEDLMEEEERLVRDTVRAWVDENVLPEIAEHHRAGTFPRRLVPQMGELGLFGANLSDYGLPGLSEVAYGLVMQELERGDSGLRSFVSVQSSLVMYPIHRYGSDEQKERWLPALASGDAIGCFGLTEPDYGSNPGGLVTRAEPDGDGWVLNGAKMWITNGTLADVAVVWAKERAPGDPEDPEGKTVRGFLVERDTPGFEAIEMRGKLSLRASDTAELVFQDCRVGPETLLPGARGLGGPLSCLNQARYGIAWGAIGAAMGCYDEARRYALDRIQFGKPIAAHQLVQAKLVEMLSMITQGQLLNLRLGRLKGEGRATPQQISLAKRNGCDVALTIARTARDVLAANGILDEYQCMRHMVNLESVKTYEGTHDIHTLIVGQHITGLSAFR